MAKTTSESEESSKGINSELKSTNIPLDITSSYQKAPPFQNVDVDRFELGTRWLEEPNPIDPPKNLTLPPMVLKEALPIRLQEDIS